MTGPQDPRTLAAPGAATIDEVYRSVGRALSSWQSVEAALASIFGMAVSEIAYVAKYSIGREAALHAYAAPGALEVRLQLAQAAVGRNFADAYTVFARKERSSDRFGGYLAGLEVDFTTLLDETRKLSLRQAEIVRGAAQLHDGSYFLGPAKNPFEAHPLSNATERNDTIAYRYAAVDIEHVADGFLDLANRLNKFLERFDEMRGTMRALLNRK